MDVLLITGYAIKIIAGNPKWTEISHVLPVWTDAIKYYGPGVVDLNLDQSIRSPTECNAVVSLLDHITGFFSEFAQTIPGEKLNADLAIPGIRFFDYEVKDIKESVTKILDLFNSNRKG